MSATTEEVQLPHAGSKTEVSTEVPVTVERKKKEHVSPRDIVLGELNDVFDLYRAVGKLFNTRNIKDNWTIQRTSLGYMLSKLNGPVFSFLEGDYAPQGDPCLGVFGELLKRSQSRDSDGRLTDGAELVFDLFMKGDIGTGSSDDPALDLGSRFQIKDDYIKRSATSKKIAAVAFVNRILRILEAASKYHYGKHGLVTRYVTDEKNKEKKVSVEADMRNFRYRTSDELDDVFACIDDAYEKFKSYHRSIHELFKDEITRHLENQEKQRERKRQEKADAEKNGTLQPRTKRNGKPSAKNVGRVETESSTSEKRGKLPVGVATH